MTCACQLFCLCKPVLVLPEPTLLGVELLRPRSAASHATPVSINNRPRELGHLLRDVQDVRATTNLLESNMIKR